MSRRSLSCGVVALGAILAPGSAPASAQVLAQVSSAQFQPPDRLPSSDRPAEARLRAALGLFEFVSSKGANQCQIMLKLDGRDGGPSIVLPYGCRKAFPALLKVDGWSLGRAGTLQLTAAGRDPASRETVLDFELRGDRLLATKDGAEFKMKPADESWFKRQKAAALAYPFPNEPVVAPSRTVTQAMTQPATVAAPAGRYEVLRGAAKAPGCELTLSGDAAPKRLTSVPNAGIATLQPNCQDRGMQIFNPVAWKMENNRLVLLARKGHDLAMVLDDGLWRKEKQSGEVLQLRKR